MPKTLLNWAYYILYTRMRKSIEYCAERSTFLCACVGVGAILCMFLCMNVSVCVCVLGLVCLCTWSCVAVFVYVCRILQI